MIQRPGSYMSSEYAKQLGAKLRAIRPPAGPFPPRSRGEVAGTLEGGRGRVVRARRPRRHRAAPRRTRGFLQGFPCRSCCPAPLLAEPPSRRRSSSSTWSGWRPSRRGPLQRYAATMQFQRGDYNGKVLSIRQERPAHPRRHLQPVALGPHRQADRWACWTRTRAAPSPTTRAHPFGEFSRNVPPGWPEPCVPATLAAVGLGSQLIRRRRARSGTCCGPSGVLVHHLRARTDHRRRTAPGPVVEFPSARRAGPAASVRALGVPGTGPRVLDVLGSVPGGESACMASRGRREFDDGLASSRRSDGFRSFRRPSRPFTRTRATRPWRTPSPTAPPRRGPRRRGATTQITRRRRGAGCCGRRPGHPVQRPVDGVGRDELVDPLRLGGVALDQLHRVLADRRLPGVGPGVPDPVREDRQDVHAALVALEEDLEGALAGPCCGQPRLAVHPAEVVARAGVGVIFSPVVMKSGTWIW